MAKLIILTLLGHNGLWIARTLEDNSKELLKNGIEIAPHNQESDAFVHHSQLWLNPEASLPRFKEIREKLDQGVSQLVINFVCPPSSYEKFANSLLKFNIRQEDVWAGIVVSRISMLFEAVGKALYGKISNSSDFRNLASINDFLNIMVPIILENIAKFGANNCHVLPDFSEFSSNDIALDIVYKLCGNWDIKTELNAAKPIYNNLCYNSATAIRLLHAMRVRDNNWPRMDGQAYMNELLQFDKQWQPEPCLPLQMREAIFNDGKVRNIQNKLESICGTGKGSFGFPKWFAESPYLDPDMPLDQKKVENFVNELPGATSEVLLERFYNDQRFLDKDQLMLKEKLAQKYGTGADFSRLEAGAEIPVLTVLTMTYNHEKYIAECMDSVLMQETDFPVRHLVLDHYSKDGTPDIVNSYAQKYPSIRPILLGPGDEWRSNVRELLGRCQSEYAALCDGDDYFTVPYKLQKQVDFLRENPKCSLVFHPVEVKFEDGSNPSFFFPPIDGLPRGVKKEYFLSDLAKGNIIQTNSVVYRWRFRDGLPEWFRTDLCPGDWYWHLLHAEVGRIGFMREVMSVYRRHANALYNHAFIDSIEHRRNTGMAELEAYKAYNDHFKGRYFSRFGNLAAGVFSDFAEIAIKEDDTSLLDEATKKYPEFARHFLEMHKKRFGSKPVDK